MYPRLPYKSTLVWTILIFWRFRSTGEAGVNMDRYEAVQSRRHGEQELLDPIRYGVETELGNTKDSLRGPLDVLHQDR